MRQKITRLVHDIDAFGAIGNADVDVQSENEIRSCDLLHVVRDRDVALIGGDFLIHPMRKRMGAGRCNFQTALRRDCRQLAAKIDNLFAGAARVAANFSTELDHRLMQLGFDVLF